MHYKHWILKYQGPCINRVLRLLWTLQEVSFIIRGLAVVLVIPYRNGFEQSGLQ